ncbi:putative pectinesterase [Lupinus albus]|uniref:Putative pectinesterase n=1 Tax=Lupinus albus TaxID=3870 RepID=A0A6A4MVG8_LUPAL|nr:putative pectinesterase [Lupinus albus]
MAASSSNLDTALTNIKSLLDASAGNKNRTIAATICLEVLHNSNYRISLANASLPSGKTKDARAWLSAALAYTYDCSSSLKHANDTNQVREIMSFVDSISTLNSNALGLVFNYDAFGNDTASWKLPNTERDGFWEKPGSVCKGGDSGCLKTIQEAVNKAPDNDGKGKKFVIYIKEGVYEEETVKVPLEKRNVVFLGDGMGKTVITGSANVGQPGVSTYTSATVGEFLIKCSIYFMF